MITIIPKWPDLFGWATLIFPQNSVPYNANLCAWTQSNSPSNSLSSSHPGLTVITSLLSVALYFR